MYHKVCRGFIQKSLSRYHCKRNAGQDENVAAFDYGICYKGLQIYFDLPTLQICKSSLSSDNL